MEHYHEAPNLLEEKKSEFPAPRFVILGIEKKIVGYSLGHSFVSDLNGPPAVLLKVENRPANVGEDVGLAAELTASIRFYREDGTTLFHTIPTAFWFERSENRITLASGHDAAVVIAVFTGNEMYTFENRRSYPYRVTHSVLRQGIYLPTFPDGDAFSFVDPVKAEVLVIQQRRKTLARAVVGLRPTESGCEAAMVEYAPT